MLVKSHYCVMYDPTIEVYREICELKWLKQLKFPTNFDTVSVK